MKLLKVISINNLLTFEKNQTIKKMNFFKDHFLVENDEMPGIVKPSYICPLYMKKRIMIKNSKRIRKSQYFIKV